MLETARNGYARLSGALDHGQSLLLLAVRLYWGWQFMQTGWGHITHINKVTEFFGTLNLPAPHATAWFVSLLELVGGALLFLGLLNRLIAIPLTINMIMAYVTADREALTSIFSDPGKFYNADPYTFLFASLLVLVFGAGAFSLDYVLFKIPTPPRHAEFSARVGD